MDGLFLSIFESFLGDYRKFNEDTGQIAFDCPACSSESNMPEGDGKGNLEINYYKGLYRCWACQDTNHMHGYIGNLIKKFGTEKNLRDYELIKPDSNFDIERKEIVVKLPKEYIKLHNCVIKDWSYKYAMKYLKSRGITDDMIEFFKIGYCNSGTYFNRIIIPSYDSENNLNYFVSRWFSDKKTKNKYLNPEANKDFLIFNEYLINWDATIYLVEGATDHLVIPNSIPLLGKYVSELLFEMLYMKAKCNIIIVLDGEELAFNDAINIYKMLNFGDLRERIRIVRPEAELDPSKIFEKEGAKGIIKLLKTARKLTDKELYG